MVYDKNVSPTIPSILMSKIALFSAVTAAQSRAIRDECKE